MKIRVLGAYDENYDIRVSGAYDENYDIRVSGAYITTMTLEC